MSTVLVSVEGVLCTDTGLPLADGESLVRGLQETHRLVLCTAQSHARTEQLIALAGINKAAHLYVETDFLTALAQERSHGNVSLVFLSDPDTAIEVTKQGITVCLVSASAFVRPDWKPNRRSWKEITDAAHLSWGGNTL